MRKMISGFLAVILALTLACQAAPPAWAASYSGGIGTERNPYLLSKPEDLAELAADVNAGVPTAGLYFRLTKDLDFTAYLAGHTWTPIGTDAYPFKGILDGRRKELKNLNKPLFNVISGANIAHLTVTGSGTLSGVRALLVVKGAAPGSTLQNCRVSGTLATAANLSGLLAGEFTGNIINCHSEGALTTASTASAVGGLVGYLVAGSVSRSSSGAAVTRGSNPGSTLTIATIGGLVGSMGDNSTADRCFATGNVSGHQRVGGLIGNANGSVTVTNSYATGSVNSVSQAGGLVGYAFSNLTLTNCYARGAVSASYSVSNANVIAGSAGGLVGYVYGSGAITLSYATGNVSGSATGSTRLQTLGGLVGALNMTSSFGRTAEISRCYATGTVNGGTAGDYLGGLLGTTYPGSSNPTKITNCYARGAVTGKSDLAGIVGGNGSNGVYAEVSNCYSSGAITASGNYAGNIIANSSSTGGVSTVRSCYGMGNVTVGGYTGAQALIGVYYMSTSRMSGNYRLSTLTVRQGGGTKTLTNSSGNLDGATMTESSLRSLSNYSGWSTSIWQNGSTYPTLRNVGVIPVEVAVTFRFMDGGAVVSASQGYYTNNTKITPAPPAGYTLADGAVSGVTVNKDGTYVEVRDGHILIREYEDEVVVLVPVNPNSAVSLTFTVTFTYGGSSTQYVLNNMKFGQLVMPGELRPGLPAGWTLPWGFQQFMLKESDNVAVNLTAGTASMTVALESA
jgi:hypothetical protein